MKIVLAIDPGSRVAGFAVCSCKDDDHFDLSSFSIIEAGVIRLNTKKSHTERLSDLHSVVKGLFEKYSPDFFVLEKAFCGVNMSSALKLGEVRGSLISLSYSQGAKLIELSPKYVKSMITGKGGASKEEVAHALELLVGFNKGKLPFDASDAVALAVSSGLYFNEHNL